MAMNTITVKENTTIDFLEKILETNTYEVSVVAWALKGAADESNEKYAFAYNKNFYAYFDGRMVKIGNNKMSFVFKYRGTFDVLSFMDGLSKFEKKSLNSINLKEGFHVSAAEELTSLWYKEKSWLDDFGDF